jgi:hypothetical protein
MFGVARNFARNLKIPQANLHAALNFVHAKSFSHCITHIRKFCELVTKISSNEQSHPEITFLKLINILWLLFQHITIGTDYFLQELQKLFELLLPKVHGKKHRMKFLPNFTEFACGAPLPLGHFLKGLKYLLVWFQNVM